MREIYENCPVCKSNEDVIWHGENFGRNYIVCLKCGRRTKGRSVAAQAVAEWNREAIEALAIALYNEKKTVPCPLCRTQIDEEQCDKEMKGLTVFGLKPPQIGRLMRFYEQHTGQKATDL